MSNTATLCIASIVYYSIKNKILIWGDRFMIISPVNCVSCVIKCVCAGFLEI